MNNDLVYRLNHVLTAEEILVAEVNKTTEMQRLRSARKELLAIIRAVARSGELEWMVATEKTIVEGDLSRYANSKAMTNSLKAALTTRLTRTNWKPSPISSRAKTTSSAKSSPTAPCHNASGVHREYDARPQCQAQPGRLAHVAASPLRLRRAKRRDAFFASAPYDGAVGARFIAPEAFPAPLRPVTALRRIPNRSGLDKSSPCVIVRTEARLSAHRKGRAS